MDNFLNDIKAICSLLGAWLGCVFGKLDAFVYLLICLVILDYISGVMVAIVQKKLCSGVGFKGIFRKALIFGMVAIAHILDTQLFAEHDICRTAVTCFYISNESISLFENSGKLGLPIPQKLKDILEQLKEQGKE